ncbi:MAG TPA: Gfo/Idh/MocA family oxidoreductase [Vicinamibacterales bacterium]|jgi:predicted dehydrogenase
MSSERPLHLAFLGCGFITRVHSRHLQSLRSDIVCSYASRDGAKAEAFRQRYGGRESFAGYDEAIANPGVDAVVVAVPPRFHLDLAMRALAAGKHVLLEKPALIRTDDYRTVIDARVRADRTVLVGENDHYKPLAVRLRGMLRDGLIGDLVFAHFVTVARRLKTADDWRNDEAMAGGDAFFEEGIHWLHLAGSLGPRIVRIEGFRPARSPEGPDRRAKSMMVAFEYDTGAVGSLYYSREIPSLLLGLRVSKLFGRLGVITFESNGICVWARGRGVPWLVIPGIVDIRGYRAMYRDFLRAVRTGATPEMSLERALEDHLLMERVYARVDRLVPETAVR